MNASDKAEIEKLHELRKESARLRREADVLQAKSEKLQEKINQARKLRDELAPQRKKPTG